MSDIHFFTVGVIVSKGCVDLGKCEIRAVLDNRECRFSLLVESSDLVNGDARSGNAQPATTSIRGLFEHYVQLNRHQHIFPILARSVSGREFLYCTPRLSLRLRQHELISPAVSDSRRCADHQAPSAFVLRAGFPGNCDTADCSYTTTMPVRPCVCGPTATAR